MNTFAARLHAAVAEVCPINGVTIGDRSSRETWVAHFKDTATDEQRLAAKSVIAGMEYPTQAAAQELGLV